MNKKHNYVLDMVQDTKFKEELAQQLESRKVIRKLISRRAALGLSQKDIAEQTRMSKTAVSRIENKTDDEIKYGDFRKYSEAVNVEWPNFAIN